jgi:ABC-2 type transport system permease protein
VKGERIRAVTRRILQQFRRDRRTLGLLFIVPLVILGLLGYLLRGAGSHTAMGVVNLDQGPIGGRIEQSLLDSKRVAAGRMDSDTAKRRLAEGTIAGYVVLPADLSANALGGGALSPEVHLEGTQPGPSGDVLQGLNQAIVAALAGAGPRLSPKVSYLHGGSGLDTLDYFGPAFIGLVVFFLVFVVTSVAFLRERSQGTLERLMASPLRRGEIVLGYMLGFGVVALVQSLIVLLFALFVLRIHNEGNVLLVFLLEALLAIGAVNLGIFLSMFARTEFQAVQFIPVVLLPQVLLSGIIFPISSEPEPLRYLSGVLPLTYAVYGMRDVMLKGAGLGSNGLLLDLTVAVVFASAMIVLASTTLRRRVA